MGAPTWPPSPQRSGRPGEPGASLDRAPGRLGAPTWPPSPRRSGRLGEPGAPLEAAWRLTRRTPPEVRLARGARLVQASHRCRHRRARPDPRVPRGLARDLAHRVAELIERLL